MDVYVLVYAGTIVGVYATEDLARAAVCEHDSEVSDDDVLADYEITCHTLEQ